MGREAELAQLNAWADAAPKCSCIIVAGEGGSGKTRLAAEFADARAKAGWRAGLVDLRRVGNASSLAVSGDTALLVDYPEERPDAVKRLLDLADRSVTGAHRLRIALLTRNAGTTRADVQRWGHPHLLTDADVHCGHAPGDYALFAAVFGAVQSRQMARKVPLPDAQAFAQWQTQSPSHQSPLFVLAAAIHATDADASSRWLDGYALLAQLAANELTRIRRTPKDGADAVADTAVDAVTLATLFDGLDLAGLRAAATACTQNRFDDLALRRALLDSQHATEVDAHCHIARIEPDLFAAAWIKVWHQNRWNADTAAGFDALLTALWTSSPSQARAFLARWNLLGYDLGVRLRQPEAWHDKWLAEHIVAQVDLHDATAPAFASAITCTGLPRAVQASARHRLVALHDTDNESEAASNARAGQLNNVAVDLAQAGRRDEALAPAQDAVTIRRRLAAHNAAAYEPALASSLNNLAIRLADAGRRDEALLAVEEALRRIGPWAARWPGAYEPWRQTMQRVRDGLRNGSDA